MKLITTVANDFIAQDGVRVTNFCLLRGNEAVAIAYFDDGKMGRTISADSVTSEQIGHFLNECNDLLEKSIPVTFKTAPVPLLTEH